MNARRVLTWAGIAGALAIAFMLYLNPHLAVDLANRVWTCF
jgi:NhaP-type Na+/H+ or K+/H+ antiporter